jgi:hypothetical protein
MVFFIKIYKNKKMTGESKSKIKFGKKKNGKAKKSFNKHDKKERNYRGQGR